MTAMSIIPVSRKRQHRKHCQKRTQRKIRQNPGRIYFRNSKLGITKQGIVQISMNEICPAQIGIAEIEHDIRISLTPEVQNIRALHNKLSMLFIRHELSPAIAQPGSAPMLYDFLNRGDS